MLKEKISVKYLIHLVSERPALWDRTSESYRDRSLKEISWHEICAYINEDFDHMPMQMRQEFSKMVSKKWTHVRDCWVKSMKNGYDDKTMKPAKPYIYHDELHFLQKMLKCQRRLDLLSKMDESEIDSYLFDDINSKFSQRSNVIANGNENENAKDNAKDGAILKRNVINENNQNDKEPKVVIEENSDFHSDADADADDDDDDNDDWPLNNDNDNNNDNGNGMIDIKEENFNEQQLEKSEPLFRTRDYFKQETKMKENTINTKQLIQTNSINPPANINNISIDNSNNAVTTTTTTAATISNNCRLYNGNKLNQIMKRKLSNSSQQGKHDNSNIHGIEMQENRHWNFFKSILPSVNHLNDIETLEFQAGVINLLQKLRNQQLTQTNRMNAQRTNGDRKRKLVDECANFEWTACNVNLASQQQQQQQQQQRQQQKQKQQQQQKRKQQQKHQQHYRTRSHQRNVAGVDPLKSAVLDLTDSNGETILDDDSDIFI